jgi:hypothetical protein
MRLPANMGFNTVRLLTVNLDGTANHDARNLSAYRTSAPRRGEIVWDGDG